MLIVPLHLTPGVHGAQDRRLDCKGGPDARTKAARTTRLLRAAGAADVRTWPDQAAVSLWSLPPRELAVTLFQLLDTASTGPAAYYADVTQAVIILAVRGFQAEAVDGHQAPPGQPCALGRAHRAGHGNALVKLAHHLRPEPLPGLAQRARGGHFPFPPPGPQVFQPAGQHQFTDVPLEEWPAREERGQTYRGLYQLATPDLESQICERIAAHATGSRERVGESWKQFVKDLPATRMQAVHMTAVRHSLPVLSYRGKGIPLDQCDPLVVVGEHAR